MKIGNYEVLFHRGKGLWSITGKDGYTNHFPVSLSKVTSPAGQKAWRFLIWEFCVEWIDRNQPEAAPVLSFENHKKVNGFYVKKRNGEIFKGWESPVVRIKSLDRVGKSFVLLNGKSKTEIENLVIITDEEANLLLKKWEDCQISECTQTEFSHIREDTYFVKIGYNEYSGRRALYSIRNKNEGVKYNLYLCDVCKAYHIGKQT